MVIELQAYKSNPLVFIYFVTVTENAAAYFAYLPFTLPRFPATAYGAYTGDFDPILSV